MEIKLNEQQIITDTWKMYIENYLKGWSWATVYNIVRVNAKNEAVRTIWKAQADAKRRAEIEAENARIEASGMDFHTYTMTRNYATTRYQGD